MSWGEMDVNFINQIRLKIYTAKVNAVIPWAVIQRPAEWVSGDPNPGTAFRVYDDGAFSVEQGYYFYKQVCRAGQSGMAVAGVISTDSEVGLIGFAANGTRNPDALVLLNLSQHAKSVNIEILGTSSRSFNTHRTSDTEKYVPLGDFAVKNGRITYTAPSRSVTTFL